MAIAAGTRLGPYEIAALLGGGGMGEVYRAVDTRLEREVALKVLPHGVVDDPSARERFRREARLASALAHPNICSVYDVGHEGAADFLVIEYVEGQTLRGRLAEGPLTPAEALSIATQIAKGLSAAHARGIVHRDLKPENVMVSPDGHVKILDFGLARRAALEDVSTSRAVTVAMNATEPGTVLGTVGYMAPEQVQGHVADAPADVFAFGAIVVEMLTGRRAFAGASPAAAMAAILRDPPDFPSAARRAAPELVAIAERCLEKSPSARYASGRELAAALGAVGSGPPRAPEYAPSPASVAVLPFADLSPEKDQDFFCEGIADEILTALGRIPGIRIASRAAAAQLGTAAAPDAVRERLGVDAYLEGSVRRGGERLRILVRLVGTKDGFQLWSERFDRELRDVFEIQEEIATSIARALRVVLGERERGRLLRGQTASVEAFDYYLRGRMFFHHHPSTRTIRVAIDLFERAVALDPSFAAAWAGLAQAWAWSHLWFGSKEEDLRRAEEAAERAMSLAPALADARAAHGEALSLSRRFEEAEREFEEATRLDPYLYEAHYFHARTCVSQGRLEEAIRRFETAAEVRPDDFQARLISVFCYRKLGREADALRAQKQGLAAVESRLEEDPSDTRALYMGSGALASLGQGEKAREWLERALTLEPDEPVVLYNAACTYAALGEIETALDALERSLQSNFGYRDWIRHDADLDPLRGHPRFQALLGGA